MEEIKMKKTLVLLMILLCTLCACARKEEKLGGFEEPKEKEITPELKEIFDKACEGYVGMDFEVLELVATQIVSGTNYKFLCNGTTVTLNPQTAKKYVSVYKDLEGNCRIIEVEDAE